MAAVVLCFLLVVDRESIIKLVVYGFTALLVIAGYQKIKLGLRKIQLNGEDESENLRLDLAIDGNYFLGMVK